MDLKQIVVAHQSVSMKGDKGELSTQQYRMIHGAIDISHYSIASCTLSMQEVYTLSSGAVLNQRLVDEVRNKGFSRIPVFYGDNPSSAFAILLTKRLIGFDTHEKLTIESAKLDLRRPLFVYPSESLLELLNKFQAGHVHMAFVCQEFGGVSASFGTRKTNCIGIITLEDVLEKLLNTNIDDEFDYDIVNSKLTNDSAKHFNSLRRRRPRLGVRRTTWRRTKAPADNYVSMEQRPLL
jgi:metal transporter CNNM